MRKTLLTIFILLLGTTIANAQQTDLIYVASPGTDSVLVIDPDSESIVEIIPVGDNPTAVASNPETGLVYVANSGDETISVIDSEENEVIETIELDSEPVSLTFNIEANQLQVTLAESGDIVTIDGDSLEVVATDAPYIGLENYYVALTLPTYPLCPLNADAARSTFQTNLTPGLIDIQCRVLAEHGDYVRPAAEIGVQAVLDLGVIHAVELFSPSGATIERLDVCLRGIGNIMYLDAADQPREPKSLQRTIRSGYTCAHLPGPGTIILIE